MSPAVPDPALDPLVDLLSMRLSSGIDPRVAGSALELSILDAGVRDKHSDSVRKIAEQFIVEARQREGFGHADGVELSLARGSDGSLHVAVKDERVPVDPQESRRLQSHRLAKSISFVEEVSTRSDGRQGNIASLRIRADAVDSNRLEQLEILDESVARVTGEQAAALEFRRMTAADVEPLIRCIYRCYGYSYPDDGAYHPRELRSLLLTERMLSVVAVEPDGELAGHAALTYGHPSDLVPEAGRLVVDPRFRGHRIAEKLSQLRLDLAHERELVGIWTECVTNHPASQRNMVHFGAHEVGLLIGGGPSDVVMADLANTNHGLRSLMPMFIPLLRNSATVSVPAQVASHFEGLAAQLELERIVATELVKPAGPGTELSAEVSTATGVGHVRLTAIGADLLEVVATELSHLIPFELGAVHLDVPIENTSAAWAIDQLEQLGFCWATWVPRATVAGDTLRLQRVGEHLVDTEHIVCAGPEGDAVRDWVLSEWHRVKRGINT